MNLHELVSELIQDTRGPVAGGWWPLWTADSSLGAFGPELVLCLVMVLLLLVRVIKWTERFDTFYIALAGTLAAFYATGCWRLLAADTTEFQRMEIFTGMLVYDGFTVFMRGILLGFAVLFVIFTRLSGIPDKEDAPDIYTLVLGSILGMCLMASANHLLVVFLAVEMASVPSYALAGMLKGRRVGSEAALKYSVYGAGAAGVMLYGISLVAGITNTVHLPTMAHVLAQQVPNMDANGLMVLTLGGLMIGVGLAFKLSAVPFHFWCPDVFEGATAEVGAFLSVASKAGALALLVRVAIGVGAIVPPGIEPGTRLAMAGVAQPGTRALGNEASGGLFSIQDDEPGGPARDAGAARDTGAALGGGAGTGSELDRVRSFVGKLVALVAILTCTFGNLAAYGQTNIKRLLAYSTIAHAGYMMMAVPPIVAMASANPQGSENAVAGLAIYLAVYLFMNLGAFAVVAFLRNEMRSEEIADYAGLIRRCPYTVIFFSLMLFSLVGLPPLAGFIGKFAIFAAIAESVKTTGQPYLLVLLIAGGINTAISLFYYLRVVKVMTMDPEPESRTPFALGMFSAGFVFILALPTMILIVMWEDLNRMAQIAASNLL